MAKTSKRVVGIYYFSIACMFLLTTAINIRYRYNKELEPHIGGADFAAPLFFFVCFLALPIFYRTVFQLKNTIQTNNFKLFLFLFFLPTIAGAINAPLPEYSYIEIARQCLVAIMVAIFLVMLRFSSVRWIYQSLALITIAQALAVAVQMAGGQIPYIATDGAHFFNEGVSRFAGIQGHPNILAGIMNIIAAFMLAGLFYESSLPRKFFLFFYILSSALVLASLSRAGLLVLGCSSLFLILIGSGRNLFAKKYLAFSGLVALGLVFFLVFGEGFQHRIFDGISSDVTSRHTLNSVALNAYLENPVVGAGSNNFIYFSKDYDSGLLTKFWKAPVHNLFFLYASESGTVGIVSFFGMLWILFSNYRKYRKLTNPRAKLLCSGAEAAFVGLLIGSLFGYFYRQDVVQPMLALLFAIGLFKFNIPSQRSL